VRWRRVASLRTPEAFRDHLQASGIELPFDDASAGPGESPFGRPIEMGGLRVGNRFCVLPMEGWDGTSDGEPSELTRRRWRNFGRSGAKLIWGGEAVAVRHDGRANPNQLLLTHRTARAIGGLRRELVAAHAERFGATGDLLVGLQLTHSGRFSRPNAHDRPEPLVAQENPLLDRRFPGGVRLLFDGDIDRLVGDFVAAGVLARELGFGFIDLKHCHGYLAHELLSARQREGLYGGPFENRTRFLREVAAGLRSEAPGLAIGVRLSAFDTLPWHKRPDGSGEPESGDPGAAFGFLDDDLDSALADARELLCLLDALSIRWVCVTAGSPYYNPHVQRPALFPPSDGYAPPEDPLRGVARQIEATARLKADFPGLVFVGSAYSYLQEWLPNVGQRVLSDDKADFIGLGRMILSYPEMPSDVLAGRPLRRASLCRTFSDCTTAPRHGLPSGCYPLDPHYSGRPEAAQVRRVKERLRP
jgi:2,4-dienoyl-CoA reductase-like NADH-dependent reductase (Old Yellow Enzyme family)